MTEEVKNLEYVGMFATEVKKENKSHKLITDFYSLLVDETTKHSPTNREKAPVRRGWI